MFRYAKITDFSPNFDNGYGVLAYQRLFFESILPNHTSEKAKVLSIGPLSWQEPALATLAAGERWMCSLEGPPSVDEGAGGSGHGAPVRACAFDAKARSLPQKYFDLVFSSFSLEHVGEAEAGFQIDHVYPPPEEQEVPRRELCEELFRITKPGGVQIHCINYGVRNVTYLDNFLNAGFELLDEPKAFTIEEMVESDEAVRQIWDWSDPSRPRANPHLHPVLVIGVRRPTSKAKRAVRSDWPSSWLAFQARIDPALQIPWSRRIGLVRSDRLLTSYPRSGNTWARRLLTEALMVARGESDVSEDEALPDIHVISVPFDCDVMHRFWGRRVHKSHNIADVPHIPQVYICRKAADCLVSYYHYHGRFSELPGYTYIKDMTLEDFCLAKIPAWVDHVQAALDAHAQGGRMLFVTYEELHARTAETVRRMLRFFDRPVDDAFVAQAVANCSFSRLREAETVKRKAKMEEEGEPVVEIEENNMFYRKGKVGSAREELSPAVLTHIEEVTAPLYKRIRALEVKGD